MHLLRKVTQEASDTYVRNKIGAQCHFTRRRHFPELIVCEGRTMPEESTSIALEPRKHHQFELMYSILCQAYVPVKMSMYCRS